MHPKTKKTQYISHSHNHSHAGVGASIKTIYFCLALNLLFVAAEAIIGLKSNSTGLLSDAGHNLSDALGLLLSLIALHIEKSGRKNASRTSHTVTLVNGVLLLAAVAIILVESIEKIVHPVNVDGGLVIWTAAAAIIINGLTAWLLMRGSNNLNIKAAYLHAATDTLVSVGVVISGIIIRYTGLNIVDPLISLVISAIITVPTLKLIFRAISSIRKD